LPTLRENKRYISFDVTSETEIDYKSAKEAINTSFTNYVGTLGVSKAGIIFVDNSYNTKTRSGIIKINNKYVDHLKASFALINKINKQPVIVKSLKCSGMINKVKI